MAIFTTYTNGSSIAATSGGSYTGAPSRTVISNVFDAHQRNLAAGDVATVLNIPAGTFVEAVVVEIMTSEVTAAQTVSVGDVVDPIGWVNAVSSSAPAGTKYLGAGTFATTGKLYTIDSTINVVMPAGMVATTLKIKVNAVCTIV